MIKRLKKYFYDSKERRENVLTALFFLPPRAINMIIMNMHYFNSLENYRTNRGEWCKRLPSEIGFWDGWIKSYGVRWKEDFKNRTDPNMPVQQIFIDYSNKKLKKNKILDVGAGPLTSIGKKHKGINFEIIPVDPLADEYSKILSKYKINPIVKTIKVEGEKLTQHFNLNTFDIAFSSNALDHSYNPLRIIDEMIKVTKKGGFIILDHGFNEGSNARWGGLHKWDFYLNNKHHFIIKGKDRRGVDISILFRKKLELQELRINYADRRFITIFKKLV